MRTVKRRPVILVASLLGVAGLLPLHQAAAASGASISPTPALQAQVKQLAKGQASPHGEDGGEADELMARAQMDALITSAPGSQAPSAALAAAQQQAAALPAQGSSWNEISRRPYLNDPVPGHGPDTISNYGVNNGLVSGRISATTSRGATVFAGGADGGVWVRSNRSASWHPMSNGLPRLSIGALATNPADGSIWLGLGEANTNFDAANGFGVYRLAQGSSTWQRVGGDELNTRTTYAIRFIGNYVYVATSRGLWRHAAAARSGSWQLVLRPDPNPTGSVYRTSHITSVVPVPGTGGRSILAALGWRGGTLPTDTAYNGFYVSKNGGAPGSFHKVTVTGDINPAEIGRTTFDTATTGRQIYAVVEDSATISLLGEGVFVSRDGNPAGPWQRIADPTKLANSDSAMSPPPSTFFPGEQAWYNQYVKVDPSNPMHVYLGLEEIYESLDGGAHWFTIAPYWDFNISCATYYYTCPPTTHSDQHAITFAADRQVYVGNDGGMWRRSMTEHGRAGWINLNATLHVQEYYSVAVGRVAGGDAVWGGMQDTGESYWAPGFPIQIQVFTGDGGDTIVNPHNGNAAVDEYVYADQFLTTDQGQHYREITVSCKATLLRAPIKNCDPNPRFIAPIEKDVNNPTHWITGGQYVWTDTAGWNTVCNLSRCDWKRAHDLGAGNSATALAMNGKTIYAGYCGGPCNPDTGGPFIRGVVTNAGGSWHDITTGLPNRYVTALHVDPANANHVYAVFGGYQRHWIPSAGVGHVFESTNAGRSWHNISGNLPDAPALQLVVSHGHLVVANDVGVFVSANGGTWHRLGSGLPRVRVWDLSLSTNGKQLLAATHGRGMWSIAAP